MFAEPWSQMIRLKDFAEIRLLGAALAALLWSATASGAPAPPSGIGTPAKTSVHIQSEQLTAELKADTAEFSGAVRVEGDGYTMTADLLIIQFRPGTVGRNRPDGKISSQDISRITARGNVRIRTDSLTAVAEQAVYEPDSGRVWLLATAPPPAAEGSPAAGRASAAASRPPIPKVRVTLVPASER